MNEIQEATLLTEEKFNFSYITPEDVTKALNRISTKAVGVDGINITLLKRIINIILPTVTHVFNASLMTSTYPTLWKQAIIRPLPKNNTPTTNNDYRPISILPTLSKALERIVHRQFSDYLREHHILDDYQSGFRTGHSTTSALLKINEDIREATDQRKLTILTLLDFSKAFDTVDIDILICKLKRLNCSGSVISWFDSYLRERQQCVLVGDRFSSWRFGRAGVPQGSILGPLLFSIYINDVTKTIKHCRYHLYADDLQLYIHSPTDFTNDALTKLNEDLASVCKWADNFGLTLNTGKSQAIVMGHQRLISRVNINTIPRVQINGSPINYSLSVKKNLGVFMDSDLNWNTQVSHVCKKVYSLLHSLKTVNDFLPSELKKRLVQALVMPHFDYCDILLTNLNTSLTDRLQRAHNACVRFICNIRRFDHVTPSFHTLSWMRLKQRRMIHSLIFLHNILLSSSPSYLHSRFNLLSTSRTHNQNLLLIPRHTTSFYSSSFSVSIPRFWNSLPCHIRDCRNVPQFRNKLDIHFISH